jgi:hypothetical protein
MSVQYCVLSAPPVVINIGVRDFAEELASQGVDVIHVNWKQPLENAEMAQLLDDLL